MAVMGIFFFHGTRKRGMPLRHVSMFEELCGADALQNIILTKMMWDQVDAEVGSRVRVVRFCDGR
jgi:hypothetical protein